MDMSIIGWNLYRWPLLVMRLLLGVFRFGEIGNKIKNNKIKIDIHKPLEF